MRWIAAVGFRFRVWLVALMLVVTVVALAFGHRASSTLSPGGFEVTGSSAAQVDLELQRRFGEATPDLAILYETPTGTFRDPAPSRALDDILRRLGEDPRVARVSASLAQGQGDRTLSTDGRGVIVTALLAGEEHDKQENYAAVRDLAKDTSLEAYVGGRLAANVEAQGLAKSDLVRTELVAAPIVLVLLVVVFRGFLAALLPLALAAFSVGCAMVGLQILALWFDVSVFAVNIVTFLGLGLAVDYALFIVQRFRASLGRGATVPDALRETLMTAGKTVAFSGFAVAASLLGLLWIPVMLLRSVAIGGTIVVLVTIVGAVFLLPACLAVLGHRVGVARDGERAPSRFWPKVAAFCIRRRYVVTALTVALLVVFGLPVRHLRTAISDGRVFPGETDVRIVFDALASERFGPNRVDAHLLLVETRDGEPILGELGRERLYAYTQELAELDGVSEVAALTRMGGLPKSYVMKLLADPEAAPKPLQDAIATFVQENSTLVIVATEFDPSSEEAREQLGMIVALAPEELRVRVGGRTADLAEVNAALSEHVPAAIATVAGVTLVVLVLAFGAIPVALKAVALNVLSLSASFGALVWVFQHGRFEDVLGYQSVGAVDPTVVVMMFALVFGLSMDYELFLLSRIRELYDEGRSNDEAVSEGLAVTGPIITRAALLLEAVVIGFMSSRLIFLKELGLGMGLAVFVDATLVRILLVPSTMALLGRFNWWAPRWFKAWWRRHKIGIDEGTPP